MLQGIRERAQGWIAWAIVILIAIPFALWGIQSYFGSGGDTLVATVNGVEITQQDFSRQYQSTRISLREQLGAAYDPDLFDDEQLRRDVLESMIRESLLLTVSRGIGLRASDEEIRVAIMANPAFHKTGRFDAETYAQALSVQGMQPVHFEEALRRRLVGTQLQRVVLASEFVTESEADEVVRLLRQQREVSYLQIRAADLVRPEAPSAVDIQAYYDANEIRFRIPERVKIEYLLLSEDALAAVAPAPSEDELRRLYEADLGRFGQPERRIVRHILIAPDTADEADEQAARAAVAAARDRILAGEAFADVARAVSEDPGSASQGGLIGEIQAGMMDPAFEAAAFGLVEGSVSESVRTPFGYHLIQVDRVLPATVRDFDEVKGELTAEAVKQGFEGLYFDLAERLATMAYESADTLAPAAEALGLRLQTSDWIPRTGAEDPLFGNPRVLSAAFSDEVLKQGLNSDLIEPERGVRKAVVLRVVDHRDAMQRPLDEVREDIIAALRVEQSRRAAEELAATYVARLKAGEALADVAGDRSLEPLRMVGRDDTRIPPEIRDLAFDLPPPTTAGGASYGSVSLVDGDVAVVAVTQVVEGKDEEGSANARGPESDAIRQLIGREYFERMLLDFESRTKIERKLNLGSSDVD